MRVCLVEDDERIRSLVVEGLKRDGVSVDAYDRGTPALEALSREPYDVVVLDLGLPDMDGIELLRTVRERDTQLPVLVLTARDAIDDRVEGLDAGADDYLVKPFALKELNARLRAVTRRIESPTDGAILRLADLTVDLHDRRATRGARKIDLSPREFSLLAFLMRHREQVVTRAMIAEEVWEQTTEHFSNVIDVYIGYLRKKVDACDESRLLHTVRGVGYRLAEDAG